MTTTDPTAPLTFAGIRKLAVYPPLGIARVGNAAGNDDYVFGPEVVGGPCTMRAGGEARYASDFRTADGAIKRQAALFRLYAELADGGIREVTLSDGVEIRWRVRLANLKAGWYEFLQAMDLPDGLAKSPPRRNAATMAGTTISLTGPFTPPSSSRTATSSTPNQAMSRRPRPTTHRASRAW